MSTSSWLTWAEDSFLAVNGFPGLEPAEGRGDRPRLCFQPIGDHAKSVVEKERWNDRLVGLDLIIGLADGSVLIRRVLKFYHHQRQAVDKEDHIGPFVLVVFDDRKLIYGKENIVFSGF